MLQPIPVSRHHSFWKSLLEEFVGAVLAVVANFLVPGGGTALTAELMLHMAGVAVIANFGTQVTADILGDQHGLNLLSIGQRGSPD